MSTKEHDRFFNVSYNFQFNLHLLYKLDGLQGILMILS